MRTAAVFLLFLALSAAFTWPLSCALRTSFDNGGDPLAGPPVLAWLGENLWTRPWALYEAPFYHPHRQALKTGFYLYLVALPYAPLRVLAGDPVAAFNLLYILTLALNGLAMYLLARRITGDAAAGVVCGMIFAFCPFRTANFQSISFMTNYWIALAFLSLFRFFDGAEEGGGARLARFALALALYLLQCLSDIITGIYFGMAFFPFIAWRMWAGRGALGRGTALKALLLLLLLAACLGVLLSPLLMVRRQLGTDKVAVDLEGIQELSSPLSAYLAATPGSVLYGRLTGGLASFSRQVNFYGLIPYLLALIGLASARGRREAGFFLPVFLLAVFVSLGPSVYLAPGRRLCASPYLLLYRGIAPLRTLRTLGGVGMVALFSLCVMAAPGARALADWFRRRGLGSRGFAAAVLSALLALEYASMPPTSHGGPFYSVPAEPSPACRWLMAQPDRGPLIELPMPWEPEEVGGAFGMDSAAMLRSLSHGRRIVNGFGAFQYPEYKIVCDQMRNFPSPETIAILRLLGVRYALVHVGRVPTLDWQRELERRHPEARYDWRETLARLDACRDLVLRFSGGGDRVYELAAPRGEGAAPAVPGGSPIPRGGWTLRASGHEADAPLATDGREDTAWVSGPCQTAGAFFRVDLGAVREVTGIALLLRSSRECPKNPRVDLSEDGSRWTAVPYEGAYLDFVGRLLADPRDRAFRIAFPARRARHLQVTLTRLDNIHPWSIAELQVYAAPAGTRGGATRGGGG